MLCDGETESEFGDCAGGAVESPAAVCREKEGREEEGRSNEEEDGVAVSEIKEKEALLSHANLFRGPENPPLVCAPETPSIVRFGVTEEGNVAEEEDQKKQRENIVQKKERELEKEEIEDEEEKRKKGMRGGKEEKKEEKYRTRNRTHSSAEQIAEGAGTETTEGVPQVSRDADRHRDGDRDGEGGADEKHYHRRQRRRSRIASSIDGGGEVCRDEDGNTERQRDEHPQRQRSRTDRPPRSCANCGRQEGALVDQSQGQPAQEGEGGVAVQAVKLLHCGLCRKAQVWVSYCDKICQRAHWQQHKLVCAGASAAASTGAATSAAVAAGAADGSGEAGSGPSGVGVTSPAPALAPAAGSSCVK
uniref:MYND-type domain-containing protein n=1 Tax=Chromera velia CCMP2878 TaxID=1169474 RepID=A0A0G4H769_9ALVE|eukprot:Cvel_5786.t1-p1 / transcript=Cvel_5786.t1 / gene=Cvel_5786 / organism=Chromera_velia_CCMP2878 / gene_product=hypothetical protein / transcript_product=hypothetical protein / location=Cvel_scaffold275:17570-18649(-) / protein_length=360 / sequence_SO=supercontig / SO=protein_coding / is_pseudo=false